MKNGNLLRRLYKLADAGNTTCAELSNVLDRYQELLQANNDPDLAAQLASVLLIESRDYPLPADWFNEEMRFETFVAGFGLSRREVALGALRNGDLSDGALDLFNVRMSRYVAENPTS